MVVRIRNIRYLKKSLNCRQVYDDKLLNPGTEAAKPWDPGIAKTSWDYQPYSGYSFMNTQK